VGDLGGGVKAQGSGLATIENTLGEPGGAAVVGDPRLAGALGDAWARRLTSDASGWHGRQMPPYSRAEDNVRRLADAGVTLLAGTDAPVCALQRRAAERRLVSCGPSVEPEPQAPELGPLTDRVSGRVVVLFCAIGQTVSLRRRVHRLADGGISPRSVSARGAQHDGRATVK
jgi:hypothetical protein